ncbi:unnamed protein product [Rhizophagus irregularis]|nr:unnamed protein product [Rhizophagus irregularis]CAB4445069.1 unnamed protein product [Rhizophagus irregularis]
MTKKKGQKDQKDQQWFDETYSKKETIDIIGKRLNFEGSLKIEGYNSSEIKLKKLKLTRLEIRNCSKLNKVEISEHNKLTSLSVTGCPELTKLNCSSNGLTSLEISGCSLNKIDLSKFTKLKSLYLRGCQKLTTLDCSSIEKLTILNISSCTELADIKSSKVEKLSVIDCPKLTTLEYSTNALTSLELSSCEKLNSIANLSKAPKLTSLIKIDCPKITELNCSSAEKLTELEVSDLTKLNCSNTSIGMLSTNLCPNIKELNCSNIKKLVNLDVSNCSELKILDCSNSNLTGLDITNCSKLEFFDCSNNKLTSLYISTESKKFKYPPGLEPTQKKPTKNLIIVGRTGGGKSTLSNVLTGSKDFEESGTSFSVTKISQKKEFPWKGKDYNVVDTIGVGDTQLSTKNVLYKILDGIFSIPEGISHILFVIDGRFTADEAKNFNLIKGSIFDIFNIKILDYVTIVRTKFSNFKNVDKCNADKEQLHNGNDIIAEIVKSCRDVVYVDNPPVNIEIVDNDEDMQTVKTNEKIRERSRKIMLDYLDKACQLDYFKLKKWDEVKKDVATYLESEYGDLPPELEKNKEILALVKISESICSIS